MKKTRDQKPRETIPLSIRVWCVCVCVWGCVCVCVWGVGVCARRKCVCLYPRKVCNTSADKLQTKRERCLSAGPPRKELKQKRTKKNPWRIFRELGGVIFQGVKHCNCFPRV
jgi:hypothetical protein